MQNEIIINAEPGETRVALIENKEFAELHIERERDKSVVGNVVKGKVSRVLPGMQAAFVDIGLERTAFLHASDIARNGAAGETCAITCSVISRARSLVWAIRNTGMFSWRLVSSYSSRAAGGSPDSVVPASSQLSSTA